MQVGFYNGNEVYIKGLGGFLPEAWVKGTLDAGTLTIPKTYLGVYTESDGDWSEDHDLYFSGSTFVYDAEAGTFYSDGGYVSYETPEVDNFYDEFKYVLLTKLADIAAVPAAPEILDFSYLDNAYPYVKVDIPAVGVNDSPVIWSKLTYQIYYCKDGEEKPLVLTTALYPELDEDMSEIPYKFSKQQVVYNNYLYLRLPDHEIDSWQKIGVQSIYYGGGERNVSEISWRDNETADGIESIHNSSQSSGAGGTQSIIHNEEGAVYNLGGQRVGRNFKGIILKDGRKMSRN